MFRWNQLRCLLETNFQIPFEICLEDMKESSVVLSCFRNCYLHSYLPYTCVQVKEGMSYIYVSIFHLNLIQLGVWSHFQKFEKGPRSA